MNFKFSNLLGAPYRGGNFVLTDRELLSPVGNRVSQVRRCRGARRCRSRESVLQRWQRVRPASAAIARRARDGAIAPPPCADWHIDCCIGVVHYVAITQMSAPAAASPKPDAPFPLPQINLAHSTSTTYPFENLKQVSSTARRPAPASRPGRAAPCLPATPQAGRGGAVAGRLQRQAAGSGRRVQGRCQGPGWLPGALSQLPPRGAPALPPAAAGTAGSTSPCSSPGASRGGGGWGWPAPGCMPSPSLIHGSSGRAALQSRCSKPLHRAAPLPGPALAPPPPRPPGHRTAAGHQVQIQ
jgi:hypothetical protein